MMLTVGILSTSTAFLFIRLAQEENIPALTVTAGRLTVAALILTPITLRYYWSDLCHISRSDFLWAMGAGFWLGLHFLGFITGLERTSILVSGVLAGTSPLWIGFLEAVFLKARFQRLTWWGLAITIIGGTVIAMGSSQDASLGSDPLLGSILILGAAMAFSLYMVIGRKTRARIAAIPYIWLVYSAATVTVWVIALFSGTSFVGYSAKGYLWLVCLALIPQLIGHSTYNVAVKYVPATFVSISINSSVIPATIYGMIFFQEIPGWVQVIGGAIILVGITLASFGQNTSHQAA